MAIPVEVGFIGLGDQGSPMALAIGDSGFSLHVWARRAASLAAVADVPHFVHPSIVDLTSACDVISLCLTDDADIAEVLGTGGMLASLRPGTVIVNHGTGDPQVNVGFARQVSEAGGHFLDAPVSGGSPGARARTMTTFVGGERAAYDRCVPIFESFSTKIAHMGAAGSGQLTKLLNNSLTITNIANVVDFLTYAQALGVNIDGLIDVVSTSSGRCFALDAVADPNVASIAEHLADLMHKDVQHLVDVLEPLGIDTEALRERGVAGADGITLACKIVAHSRR
jgi:3-hydroxyisobutyrate dehydrogenase-like beta-hydroxyacid dehydrogenase